MKYTEVSFAISGDEIIIKPTKNKILANANTNIEIINFQTEKEKIIQQNPYKYSFTIILHSHFITNLKNVNVLLNPTHLL